MSPGSVHLPLGLLCVTVRDNIWVSAQQRQEATVHQIDGLCDFSVCLELTYPTASLLLIMLLFIFPLWNLAALLSDKMGFTLAYAIKYI